jgi:hypothetical protein
MALALRTSPLEKGAAPFLLLRKSRDDHRHLALVLSVVLSVKSREGAFFEADADQSVERHRPGEDQCPTVMVGVAQRAMKSPTYMGWRTYR